MLKSETKVESAWGGAWRKALPNLATHLALLGLLAVSLLTLISCTEMTAGANSEPAPVMVSARGSSAMPTDISTLSQLRSMSLTGNYRLTKDITMTANDAGFVPIGSPFNPFRGTFDGNGFSIINFRTSNNANNPGWYRGLFSGTDGAILKKVRLTNVDVVGEAYTGAIVGYMNNTLLTDSYVTGTVSGLFNTSAPGYALGMAVGFAGSYSEIYKCYATGSIKGVVMSIGGFIGEIRSYGFRNLDDDPRVKVEEIFTNVNVNATPPGPTYDGLMVPSGGIVGLVQGATIKNIYAVGNVKGRGSPGGIVGRVVNDDPNTMASELTQGVYIGDVASTSGSARAGAIGSLSGDFLSGSRCAIYYNKTVDGGAAIPTSTISCNAGKTTQELQVAHAPPNRLLTHYIIGALVDQQFLIDHPGVQPCKLASGSDGDWGFGTCGDPFIWKANADNQYSTLNNIPNPSVQPLQ